MNSFDIVYGDIRLRIICDSDITPIIKKHFFNHKIIEASSVEPTYTLILSSEQIDISGNHYKMVDKWFDNASLDCYINNDIKTCQATNFVASSDKYRKLIIKYLAANVFNRLLEIYGYIGIHSSCVDMDGNGLLFVAERNNGKTVCMLNLINNGFDFVTNDITAIKSNGTKVNARGISDSISIRLSPAFCEQPENKKYVEFAKQRNIQVDSESKIDGNKLFLSEQELINLSGSKKIFDTEIKGIIRPFYNPYEKELEIYKMSQTENLDLLLSQYLPLVHETTYFLKNIKLDNVDNEMNKLLMIDELSKVPCYFCSQNENTTTEFIKQMRKVL